MIVSEHPKLKTAFYESHFRHCALPCTYHRLFKHTMSENKSMGSNVKNLNVCVISARKKARSYKMDVIAKGKI